MGKSLAHLLTILAASFSFTACYYALLLPVDVPICTYLSLLPYGQLMIIIYSNLPLKVVAGIMHFLRGIQKE